MKKTFTLFILLVAFSLWPTWTSAHKPSDSYLTLRIDGAGIQGQWDIALRDLEQAIGLDADQDGNITWGELRVRHATISAYALSHLAVSQKTGTCTMHPKTHLVDHHSDGAYAVLRFSIECPQEGGGLQVVYNLFFEFDQLHRGLLRVEQQGTTKAFIFSPTNRAYAIDPAESSSWVEFQRFAKEGMWHIWRGYDHVLFLLSLLLPSVLIWEAGQWKPMPTFRLAFWEVIKIVTAFTLAHSLTLTLAVFQIINLPSRWVESTIAASVFIAALHNLFPLISRRIWLVALAFGLVHGLGFATVLLDLGLSGRSLLPSLGGFNVGVEVGQIAIVAPFLLLAFGARETWWYQALVLRAGSGFIAVVALVWLMERSLNLRVGFAF